jgi:hypothetical protein
LPMTLRRVSRNCRPVTDDDASGRPRTSPSRYTRRCQQAASARPSW